MATARRAPQRRALARGPGAGAPASATRDTWAAYAFLSPWLFGFLVFTAGPMIASLDPLVHRLLDHPDDARRRLGQLPRSSSTTRRSRTALRNTFVYTLLAVPAHVIISLALASLLVRVGRAAGFFRTIFYLPVMTPAVAVGILYLLLFNG